MAVVERFSPGELVRARGREWVVVEAHSALSLRPLTGSEADVETIVPIHGHPAPWSALVSLVGR